MTSLVGMEMRKVYVPRTGFIRSLACLVHAARVIFGSPILFSKTKHCVLPYITICRPSFLQLRAMRWSLLSHWWLTQTTEIPVQLFAIGRLQAWNKWRPHSETAVGSECGSSTRHCRLSEVCVSETLRKLHWLPVRKRIAYKLTLLVSSVYVSWTFSDQCTSPITVGWCLHCSIGDSFKYPILVCFRYTYRGRLLAANGTRSFSVTGPVTWHDLSLELHALWIHQSIH